MTAVNKRSASECGKRVIDCSISPIEISKNLVSAFQEVFEGTQADKDEAIAAATSMVTETDAAQSVTTKKVGTTILSDLANGLSPHVTVKAKAPEFKPTHINPLFEAHEQLVPDGLEGRASSVFALSVLSVVSYFAGLGNGSGKNLVDYACVEQPIQATTP